MVSRYGRNAVAVLSFYKRQGTVKLHNMRQISVKSSYYSNSEQRKCRLDCRKMAYLSGFLNGARDGTRTHDLLITNQLRYQLRHSSGYLILTMRGISHPQTLTVVYYSISAARMQAFFRISFQNTLCPALQALGL